MVLEMPDETSTSIETDFAKLEADLQAKNPGINDLLRAYAPYDAAAKLAEQYLSAFTPSRSPKFTTDNSTAR